MRIVVALLAALPLLAGASPATSPSPVLEPASPWRVQYNADYCSLSRDFGRGDQAVVMQFKRESGPDQYEIAVAGSAVPTLSAPLNIRLRLVGQNLEHRLSGFSMLIPMRSEGIARADENDASFLDAITEEQQLELRLGTRHPMILHLTGARAALAAFDKCYDTLLASWGVDRAEIKKAKVPPKPTGNPAHWATTEDYPAEALRQRKFGPVEFMLMTDALGMPKFCKVIRGSETTSLNEKTCFLMMKRARFKPARDDKGNAVSGYFISRVNWIIPS